MFLAGVGDALGYKNGEWEFCRMGERIEFHGHARELRGVVKIKVNLGDWMVSAFSSEKNLQSPD